MRVALIYLGRRGAGGRISLELARHLGQRLQGIAAISRQAEQRDCWTDVSFPKIEVDTYQTAFGALLSLVVPNRLDRLAEQIHRFSPDVLLFPMFHPWNAGLQQRLAEIPSVVFVHDPQAHPDLSGWFYQRLEDRSLRRASRCVVLSRSLIHHLVRRGVDGERVDVVPLGAFSYSHTSLSDKAGNVLDKTDRHVPTLLFFGRIVSYKGLDILIRAYTRLRTKMPCRLVIAGEGRLAPYRPLLKHLPEVKVINRWIAEDEIASIFARSDLVVLPYTSASQSGIIPIAASFGLPVVATRVGGLEEQIEEGVSGWLVPARDEQALVAAMYAALSNRDEARKRGFALKERYETLFGWERIADLVVKSLELAKQARGSA